MEGGLTVPTLPHNRRSSSATSNIKSACQVISDATAVATANLLGTVERSQGAGSPQHSHSRVPDSRYNTSKPSLTRSHVQFEETNRLEKLLGARGYSAYTKGRKRARDNYELCKSNREWWRTFVLETPVPGHYECHDQMGETPSASIPPSCSFVGQGRSVEPGIIYKGEVLIPGLYQVRDFIELLERKRITYNFKNSGRKHTPVGYKDKDLLTEPTQYNVPREPIESTRSNPSSSFRSQTERFPKQTPQKAEAPPLGTYNPQIRATRFPMSSCFQSTTPRFEKPKKWRQFPGPGMYEPTAGSRRTKRGKVKPAKTVTEMGRKDGLFFPVAITV